MKLKLDLHDIYTAASTSIGALHAITDEAVPTGKPLARDACCVPRVG